MRVGLMDGGKGGACRDGCFEVLDVLRVFLTCRLVRMTMVTISPVL